MRFISMGSPNLSSPLPPPPTPPVEIIGQEKKLGNAHRQRNLPQRKYYAFSNDQ